MAFRRNASEPINMQSDESAAGSYRRLTRSVSSILMSLLCLILVWPRIQMFRELVGAVTPASNWFAAQFCYSLAGWCILGLAVLGSWLMMMAFRSTVFMKLTRVFVALRTAAWYCSLPGFLFLYIAVTSKTCYMDMNVFLVTMIGGLLLLILAGVYAFRLYALCRITADMGDTLATGSSAYAFGYSFNMTAANIVLAAAALFAADYMSDYRFLAMMFKTPYAEMLQALNAWMSIQCTSWEISIGQFYLDIPWVAIVTAATNIPLIFLYKQYMKASQLPASEAKDIG